MDLQKEIKALVSEDGSIPPVNPDDLRSVWKMQDEIAAQNANQPGLIGRELYARACSPGANVMAVWFRVSMLRVMAAEVGLLPREMPSKVRAAVFDVMAKFEMKRMQPLEACAPSDGGKETLAHAVKISSGGPPIFLLAEEESFTFVAKA